MITHISNKSHYQTIHRSQGSFFHPGYRHWYVTRNINKNDNDNSSGEVQTSMDQTVAHHVLSIHLVLKIIYRSKQIRFLLKHRILNMGWKMGILYFFIIDFILEMLRSYLCLIIVYKYFENLHVENDQRDF